ncbi:hypothetical protein BaRGS_00003911 [Batillaria attramentaria]|uniref:Uncharacterized protein n=1 Tax=Batillaria attramentaria TaxID=370345 RepID=A0ABD0M0H3_9CAEN
MIRSRVILPSEKREREKKILSDSPNSGPAPLLEALLHHSDTAALVGLAWLGPGWGPGIVVWVLLGMTGRLTINAAVKDFEKLGKDTPSMVQVHHLQTFLNEWKIFTFGPSDSTRHLLEVCVSQSPPMQVSAADPCREDVKPDLALWFLGQARRWDRPKKTLLGTRATFRALHLARLRAVSSTPGTQEAGCRAAAYLYPSYLAGKPCGATVSPQVSRHSGVWTGYGLCVCGHRWAGIIWQSAPHDAGVSLDFPFTKTALHKTLHFPSAELPFTGA